MINQMCYTLRADDLEVNEEGFLLAIRQPMSGEINWNEFICLGFTHHMEILSETNVVEERIFSIEGAFYLLK